MAVWKLQRLGRVSSATGEPFPPDAEIVTALFGGLHPLWTIPSSFLFGGLLVGANSLQRAVQVPQALIVALNGLVVVFVVSSEKLRQRRAADVAEISEEDEPDADVESSEGGPP